MGTTTPGTYADNQWHYVAVVRDATSLSVFIDAGGPAGTPQAVVATPAPTTAYCCEDVATIGNDDACFCFPLTGWESEVALYDQPLSAARIKAHYTASGVIANLPVNVGSGALDTGTQGGGAYWMGDCEEGEGGAPAACALVAFSYHIRARATYDIFQESGTPSVFFHLTSGGVDADVPGGRQNIYGLDLTVKLGLYLTDNWQRLSCVRNGQVTGPTNIPLPAQQVVQAPNNAYGSFAGPISPSNVVASAYDPLIFAQGVAVDLRDPYAGFMSLVSNPGVAISTACSSPASGLPSPASTVFAPDAHANTASRRHLSVPTVTLDGHTFTAATVLHEMTLVHRATGKPRAATATKRTAIALLILNRLITEASSQHRVSAARVRSALNALVAAYNKDPSAARHAGIHIRDGQSVHDYFFRASRRAVYASLLSTGALRNSIMGNARTDKAVRQRYRVWLAGELRHHRIALRRLRPFPIAGALP